MGRCVRVPAVLLTASAIAAAFGAIPVEAQRADALTVLHVGPSLPLEPSAPLVVTFDRPVAPRLGESVDPATVITWSPDVRAVALWRDPASILLVPDPLWPLDGAVNVRVTAGVTAADGTRLATAREWIVPTAPARVLAVHFARMQTEPRAPVEVLLDAEVPPGRLAERARIRPRVPGERCGPSEFGVEAVGSRPLAESDDQALHRPLNGVLAGVPEGSAREALRTRAHLLQLRPVADLVRGCDYDLFVPNTVPAVADTVVDLEDRSTWYNASGVNLRLLDRPGLQSASCEAGGGCRLHFRTAMDSDRVAEHVRLQAPMGALAQLDPAEVASVRSAQDFDWSGPDPLTSGDTVEVLIASGLTDAYAQPLDPGLQRVPVHARPTAAEWTPGRLLAVPEADRFVLPVAFTNAGALRVDRAWVPRELEQRFLRSDTDWFREWNVEGVSTWYPVPQSPDTVGSVRLPITGRRDTFPSRMLQLVRISAHADAPDPTAPPSSDSVLSTDPARDPSAPATAEGPLRLEDLAPRLRAFPVAVVQFSDLAVHTLAGVDQTFVWITDARTGRPVADVEVTLHGGAGEVRARGRTDADGTLVLEPVEWSQPCLPCAEDRGWEGTFEGWVEARTETDRVLAPLRVGATPVDGLSRIYPYPPDPANRAPLRLIGFTERDLYRPGDSVFAKAIVRVGARGALTAPASDSVRWTLRDPRGEVLLDSVTTTSAFGGTEMRVGLAEDAPVGYYRANLHVHRGGTWRPLGALDFRVAAYRPPSFLLDLIADTLGARFTGELVTAQLEARYVFDAPMVAAPVSWRVTQRRGGRPDLPALEDGWQVGAWGPSIAGDYEEHATLDPEGRHRVRVPTSADADGYGLEITVAATVEDAVRQARSAETRALLHPGSLYPAVRMSQRVDRAGDSLHSEVLAVDLGGDPVADVQIDGVLVFDRAATGALSRGSVANGDTVATCSVRSALVPQRCTVVPPEPGLYRLLLRLADEQGRPARTEATVWAQANRWVRRLPPPDTMALDIRLDRERYVPGDTMTVRFEAPFPAAQVLVTVQQERVLWSRVYELRGGAHTVRVPVTERFAPQGRVQVWAIESPRPPSAPRLTRLRLGYATYGVEDADLGLEVELEPPTDIQRPGDSTTVAIRVRDRLGRGVPAEVAIWAVDEGVLSLTGFEVPDVGARMYRMPAQSAFAPATLLLPWLGVIASERRGIFARAMHIDALTVAASRMEPQEVAIRSDFRSTAFFFGMVRTDTLGRATVRARLPDNLTTYRVMAVAADRARRFGQAEAHVAVDRPFRVRPALPRFLRPGDRADAGLVVVSSVDSTVTARVDLEVEGAELQGASSRSVRVESGPAQDVRFSFVTARADSARFLLRATAGTEGDAVRVVLPVAPNAAPLVATLAGTAAPDPQRHLLRLDARSEVAGATLEIGAGTSPSAFVGALLRQIDLYPYQNTQHLASSMLASVALHGAQIPDRDTVAGLPIRRMQDAIAMLVRRQRTDGGIGYWDRPSGEGRAGFTSPSLSALAARALLEARAAGFAVPDSTFAGVARYLAGYLDAYVAGRSSPDRAETAQPPADWVTRSIDDLVSRFAWSERVAAAELLGRLGRSHRVAEDALIEDLPSLEWTDRLHLARSLGHRGDSAVARRLLEDALASTRVEGRALVLPPEATRGAYGIFRSRSAPLGVLVSTLVELAPGHPLQGAATERLVAMERAEATARPRRRDHSFDLGLRALALHEVARVLERRGSAALQVVLGADTIVLPAGEAARDTVLPIPPEWVAGRTSFDELQLTVASTAGSAPLWFHATLRARPVDEMPDPLDDGIRVERWYERFDTGAPTVRAAEGDLIRVRVRVTVGAARTFVVLEDPLPAGLEALAPDEPITPDPLGRMGARLWPSAFRVSPWLHSEMRDDRVVHSAVFLWPGEYHLDYVVRATTAGSWLFPPALAWEAYDPGIEGRSAGGRFQVERR